jgi:hypothetical protein
MNLFNLNEIYDFDVEPVEQIKFDNWIRQENVLKFLESDVQDDYIIIYASLPHTFLHSVFVPDFDQTEDKINDLKSWSGNPYSSWSIVCSSDDAWIEPPLASSGSEILATGEQIVFGRSFEGLYDNESYYELNQKLAHILGIHFLAERKAWCKLDNHGDIVDVFKIIEIDNFPGNRTGKIICARIDSLKEYAGIENLILIRMFDFTRFKSGNFSGWGSQRETESFGESESVYGSLTIESGVGSYSRGMQLINLRSPKSAVLSRVWDNDEGGPKKYCAYIAQDLKNKVITEISCDPACLSNYFTESDLPFEVTPVFFKPEVLSKYKSDRAKYKLDHRSVSCRGAWNLQTFDVNSAGQVHTYLIYLSRLPYEEQLHWRQYNEKPKATISARALKTDFEGEFYEEYDPLLSLKRKLEQLLTDGVPWWTLRDENAPNKVHYPYTESKDEWSEEILNLDQLLVEGLQEKWLRNKAKELGCNPEAKLRALKLLEVILVALGFEDTHAREIITPFHIVHNLRSLLKGHSWGTDAEQERKKALLDHGSFRNHFSDICAKCDESIRIIAESIV